MTERPSSDEIPFNLRTISGDGRREDSHGTSVALPLVTMPIEGGIMRRLSFLTTNVVVLALSIVTLSGVAYPCSAVRSSAHVDLFTCPCPDGTGGELTNPIY